MKNKIFFGCNYSDKAVKECFDNLKKRIENDYPVQCVIIDKRETKSATDIWKDIREEIEQSEYCVFDLSGFRPNVVLELGYALSVKNTNQIMISFRQRKPRKGEKPKWILSDIGHLIRTEYNSIRSLEDEIRNQIKTMSFIKNLEEFKTECYKVTTTPDKYYKCGIDILKEIRTNISKNDEQIKDLIKGSSCQSKKLIDMLVNKGLLQLNSKGRYVIQ